MPKLLLVEITLTAQTEHGLPQEAIRNIVRRNVALGIIKRRRKVTAGKMAPCNDQQIVR